MKRFYMPLIAALLAASTLSFAQETAKNFIRNPQFLHTKNNRPDIPDGRLPEPWYIYGGIKKLPAGCGVNKTEKPENYSGNSYCVTGNALISQSSMAIVPGKTYRISCKVKTKDVAPAAQIRLQVIWADKNWREIMKDWVGKNGKVTKGWDHKWVWLKSAPDWKELVIPAFIAPPNAKYAIVRFGNGFSKDGSAWFADFKMVEVTENKTK